jgi:paraquat-inducible protein A
MAEPETYQILCPQCESKITIPALAHRQKARCPHCGHTITTCYRHATDSALALSLTALIFLLLTLPFNFLSFKASGQQHSIDLIEGMSVLITNDYLSLGIITALATLILPGLVLLGIATLSIAMKISTPQPWMLHIQRVISLLTPWSMAEIFLLGTIVSVIKITSLADISIGLSFYAFVLFTLNMTACLIFYDEHRVKLWLYQGQLPLLKKLTRRKASLSIQRTWAFIFTAWLFYIPANTLPIMHTELFGKDEPNTLLGGVITLWNSGSYPVAIVIFIASVVVPVVKLVILIWLNYTVQSRTYNQPIHQTRLYKFTEFIGRWSMVDVFVVAVLVALIQLGNTISVYPGPAALAFCAVVFVTMIAAMTFDARLIWLSKDTVNNE